LIITSFLGIYNGTGSGFYAKVVGPESIIPRFMNRKQVIGTIVIAVLLPGVTVVSKMQVSQESHQFSLSEIIAKAQAASVDYFLKIEGIEGESTDKSHKGEIQIESWSWGETNTGSTTGGGGGAGKVQMQDFHFTMKVDKATPKLMLAVAKGEHIRSAKRTVRSSDKTAREFLIITMENVLVSSLQLGGSNGGVPTEQISLNFEKIKWSYTALDGEKIEGGWDVAGNQEI
jgi:type VI secretion system secreted protein Hcp